MPNHPQDNSRITLKDLFDFIKDGAISIISSNFFLGYLAYSVCASAFLGAVAHEALGSAFDVFCIFLLAHLLSPVLAISGFLIVIALPIFLVVQILIWLGIFRPD
ncbi:hypothetical protein PUV47_01900 [Pseudovibrio exalbescens]|uniref:hypothetical protein n=1 Tax=Pseudovibrio exalbescens TaxID=197461 RepID=UPI00236577E0|nr:hypothetical protein [Pseudovibrio exalbescens]MDD7908657.1 hypothetical protein [Pseudovibrio exalbescens]